MANPVKIDCSKSEWTKVIDGKTTGNVFLKVPDWPTAEMTEVWFCVQDTGAAEPTDFDIAVRLDDNILTLDRTAASDVWLYPAEVSLPVVVDA
jgi:hypothetical protein